MDRIFLDFYSHSHPRVFTKRRGGLMGALARFTIPLLKTVIPVLVGTVSDYFTKDISLTQAITDNVRPRINKLKRKWNNNHGSDHRRKIRAVSI